MEIGLSTQNIESYIFDEKLLHCNKDTVPVINGIMSQNIGVTIWTLFFDTDKRVVNKITYYIQSIITRLSLVIPDY